MPRPIVQPNLPKSRVTLAALGERGAAVLREPLAALGVECLSIPAAEALPADEADHADLLFHHAGGENVIISQEIICKATELYIYGFEVETSERPLIGKYPGNVALNLCRIGSFAIHRLDATAPSLIKRLRDDGVRLLDTRQGYTKCSVCVVDDSTVITADPGICRALTDTGIECLRIAPGGISLEGMDGGFIGGASGKLAPDVLAFTGHLRGHPDEERIRAFVESRGVRVICLTDRPCFDVGSILPIMEEGGSHEGRGGAMSDRGHKQPIDRSCIFIYNYTK